MTAKELEAQIQQKIDVDFKNALTALKTEQKEELKALRAELAKKKRQEYAKTVDEVGRYLISKFDKDGHHNYDMTAHDYIVWIDDMINFVKTHQDNDRY